MRKERKIYLFSTIFLLFFIFQVKISSSQMAVQTENTPVACKDGIDNDGDTFIDCSDQDCSFFVFCSGGGTTQQVAPSPGATYGTKREPRKSKGGVGMYLSIDVFGHADRKGKALGVEGKAQYRMNPTAGLGLFGEALVAPVVALGGEIYIAFPKIAKGREYYEGSWSSWYDCNNCVTDVLFNANFRLKFPIKLIKWLSLYPMITAGLGNYAARHENSHTENFLGIAFGAGIGLEGYTPVIVTPFFEIRYYGGAGWNMNKDEGVDSDMAVIHFLSLNLGVRIL